VKRKIALRVKLAWDILINWILFGKNYDGVSLRCLEKLEIEKILNDLHNKRT
jgi:hypothetical protein